MALILTSESFKEGQLLGAAHVLSEDYGFGCAGNNLSPQLSWSGAPDGTLSYALTCFDPDAPTGSGFWHWVVANIQTSVSSLPLGAGDPSKGAMPAGALEVRTDFGKPGYGGPLPPPGHGAHHYFFVLMALDKVLELKPGLTLWQLMSAVESHVIGMNRLMGTYQR